jgi:two-component sensor histidine kinase
LTLELDWTERGGPPPKRVRKPGFGSRLIEMVIHRQLSGAVERKFGPEGLDARLIIPLTHERWPEPATNEPPSETTELGSFRQT